MKLQAHWVLVDSTMQQAAASSNSRNDHQQKQGARLFSRSCDAMNLKRNVRAESKKHAAHPYLWFRRPEYVIVLRFRHGVNLRFRAHHATPLHCQYHCDLRMIALAREGTRQGGSEDRRRLDRRTTDTRRSLPAHFNQVCRALQSRWCLLFLRAAF